jgi:hypothetical protein
MLHDRVVAKLVRKPAPPPCVEVAHAEILDLEIHAGNVELPGNEKLAIDGPYRPIAGNSSALAIDDRGEYE